MKDLQKLVMTVAIVSTGALAGPVENATTKTSMSRDLEDLSAEEKNMPWRLVHLRKQGLSELGTKEFYNKLKVALELALEERPLKVSSSHLVAITVRYLEAHARKNDLTSDEIQDLIEHLNVLIMNNREQMFSNTTQVLRQMMALRETFITSKPEVAKTHYRQANYPAAPTYVDERAYGGLGFPTGIPLPSDGYGASGSSYGAYYGHAGPGGVDAAKGMGGGYGGLGFEVPASQAPVNYGEVK